MTLLAVTVLTSLDAEDLNAMGIPESTSEHATRLAKLAWAAGVRGFVPSPLEAERLRAELGPEAYLVTPGIRPGVAASGDQKRVASPAAAIAAGSDLLVVGRPIHGSTDPAARAAELAAEIAAARAALGSGSRP